MALSVKHKFHSAKGDGTDSTRVRPSNWNDDHAVQTEADGVVLGRPAGAGPGDVQEVPMSGLFPAGVVMAYAGATAPAGWLLCNGQSLLRTEYPNLFLAIGTVHGQGDTPGSTFAAPDCRGRVITGHDGGTNRLPGWVLGTVGGQAYIPGSSLGVAVGGWFAGGSYVGSGYTGGQQSVQINIGTGGVEGGNWYGGIVGGGDTLHGNHWHSVSGGFWTDGQALGVAINSFGASGGVTSNAYIVQPSIAMNQIIKT